MSPSRPPSASNHRVHLCPSCLRGVIQFANGPGGRPNARCPHCNSLERHRFLALLLEGLGPAVTSARVALDIAPTPQTTTLFQRLQPERYVRMDFDPAADKRAVDVQASMTAIPLPDGCVDLAVCYHVLEHIPDDRAAMAELARVLAPAGLALVQVPWRPAMNTDEDPDAPVAERIRRFGQADHVRYYGGDFEDRLRAAGLSVLRFTPDEVAGAEIVDLARLQPNEAVWLVRRSEGHVARTVDGSALRLTALATLAEDVKRLEQEVASLKAEVRAAEKQSAKWERAYHGIRSRLPVRVAAGAARRLGLRRSSPRS